MFGLNTWQTAGAAWLIVGVVATFLLWVIKGRKAKAADKPGIIVNLMLTVAGPLTALLLAAAFVAARRAIKFEKRKAALRQRRY